MVTIVTQEIPGNIKEIKIKAEKQIKYRRKTAAFRDWQFSLKRGDTLPRGKFFKGKKAGGQIVITDEAHLFISQVLE